VTVCVASLFRWNYAHVGGQEQLGAAAIVAADRMITAGDVQYEPFQSKMAQINDRTLILVAGDYSIHSQAIKDLEKQVRKDNSILAESIAVVYGKAIQRLKRREAEDLYLAPLGLNTDTFLAQQKEMSESFVQMITNQLQAYHGENVEALIVGGSRDENSHIYLVDTRGMVSCCDDVGFAAIGSGAWHARSRLMQAGYTNSQRFAAALAMTYAAKKAQI
jgi:20S proteasome alpha/beta subunit